MSENLTHTAVTDDLARLALNSADVCDAFKTALDRQIDIVRLGGTTRWGARFAIELLDDYRQRWPEDEMLEQKLGFVLGWLSHRAADLQMKPVFRATCPNSKLSPTECSVYHDVFVLKHVYGGGTGQPYDPVVLADPAGSLPGGGVATERIEHVFRVWWQRMLLAIHTIIPDPDDVDAWIEELIKRRQRLRVDLARYARAYAEPDPDKVKRFIEDINFYDPEDGLIRLARGIQHDASVDVILDDALEEAATQSHYAQCLRRGYIYLRASSDYFTGSIDQDALREDLEMNGPGQ